MGSVQAIDPDQDLGRFFDMMYGSAQGYVYIATKDPESSAFYQNFFQWPQKRDAIVAHCVACTKTKEVYYGPALYKRAKAEKEDFLGTYYVWCEFDGNAPDDISGLPAPSLKVQSSKSSHQHWYWRLDHFETDIKVIESISNRITYHAQADLSAWNANRVLRPPGTIHHESGLRVQLLSAEIYPFSTESFTGLPTIPVALASSVDVGEVPAPLDVLMQYKFTTDETQFFKTKTIAKGHRSSALTKFAHYCIEKEMTNADTLSLLLSLDERWGKFRNRKDQKDRLLGIINHVRSRHPVDPVVQETTHTFRVFTYEEFINSEVKLEWVVPNLIHANGSVIVAGAPGVGKSQLSIRFAEKIAKGEPFLKWSVDTPKKILVVSMEMPFEELNFLIKEMKFHENEALRNNLLISTPGHSIKLNDKKRQQELNRIIEDFQPEGIIFDSFGMAINDDMSSDKIILETFDYVNGTLRGEYGLFTWFIHHNRKAQIGNPRPKKLDDLYGNQYIGANITTGIGLYKPTPSSPIEVSCLKLRMAPEFSSFQVQRTTSIDFQVIGGNIGGSSSSLSDKTTSNALLANDNLIDEDSSFPLLGSL